jgi:hypothetical protein
MMNRFHRIIQVKTVVLIGILAVGKFIIVNIETTSATTIAASAFALIALRALYWLKGEKDKREALFGRSLVKGYKLRVASYKTVARNPQLVTRNL